MRLVGLPTVDVGNNLALARGQVISVRPESVEGRSSICSNEAYGLCLLHQFSAVRHDKACTTTNLVRTGPDDQRI